MRIVSFDLHPVLLSLDEPLDELRQNSLQDSSNLRSWHDGRGEHLGLEYIEALWRRRLVLADRIRAAPKNSLELHSRYFVLDDQPVGVQRETDTGGERRSPQFHPFRTLPITQLKHGGKVQVSHRRDQFLHGYVSSELDAELLEEAEMWNGVADLAIILEPCYWPWITSRYVGRALTDPSSTLIEDYCRRTREIVQQISVEDLRDVHGKLCIEAKRFDPNSSLYLILRAASWDGRLKLQGRLSLALWYRHIAEVIRHATKEAHEIELPEEDVAPGHGSESVRQRMYGTLRPLDYPSRYLKAFLTEFHLDSAVIVRWYVEGDTEFGYLEAAMGSVSESQVELVNLRGCLAGAGIKEWWDELKRDLEAERFSFISIDGDVKANLEAIRRTVRQDLVCGLVFINNPDFEIGNFTVEELIEAAILFDQTDLAHPTDSSELLHNGPWEGIRSGSDFEKRYLELHEHTRPALKGKRWGATLFDVHSQRTDGQRGNRKAIDDAISAAYRSTYVQFSFERTKYKIDDQTFQNVART